MTGTPGDSYKISFTTDGIDVTKPANMKTLNASDSNSISFDLEVNLRNCSVGESFNVLG